MDVKILNSRQGYDCKQLHLETPVKDLPVCIAGFEGIFCSMCWLLPVRAVHLL